MRRRSARAGSCPDSCLSWMVPVQVDLGLCGCSLIISPTAVRPCGELRAPGPVALSHSVQCLLKFSHVGPKGSFTSSSCASWHLSSIASLCSWDSPAVYKSVYLEVGDKTRWPVRPLCGQNIQWFSCLKPNGAMGGCPLCLSMKGNLIKIPTKIQWP